MSGSENLRDKQVKAAQGLNNAVEPHTPDMDLSYASIPHDEVCGGLTDGFTQPEDALREKQRREAIEQCLDIVASTDPRGAQALRLRFGLDGGEPMTFQEIGDVMGFSGTRARNLEARASAALRGILFKDYGVKSGRRPFWVNPELTI